MKKRILIVEDNLMFARSLKLILEKYNFNIDIVDNKKGALKLLSLKNNHYDILLVDGVFPEHEGEVIDNNILDSRDYRGNYVAKVAKGKGIYVIGMSMEPEKLNVPDTTIDKKSLKIPKLIEILKEH